MIAQTPLTIGVLSDTHLPYRMATLPPVILEIFDKVDFILHAGDVDKIELLHPLTTIAPLYAVRGNVHLLDFSWGGRELPFDIHLLLANRRVVLTHGHRAGIMEWVLKIPEFVQLKILKMPSSLMNQSIARRLAKRYPKADVIIFGHTHAPFCERIGQTLFFNPGSVVPSPSPTKWTSVGMLKLWPDKIETEIIRLSGIE